MSDEPMDLNRELMLDGNAVGGLMLEIFGLEMTTVPAECANCGKVSEMGETLAFTQAPGVILRCPACEEVMVRIVQTPEAVLLDMRGAAYMRLARTKPEQA